MINVSNYHEVYIDDEDKKANSNTYYIKDNKKLNIVFLSNYGLKVNLKVSAYISLEEMFKLFAKRLKVEEKYIGKEIQFLLGGKLLDPFSKNIVEHEFQDGMLITVFDQNGVVGA